MSSQNNKKELRLLWSGTSTQAYTLEADCSQLPVDFLAKQFAEHQVFEKKTKNKNWPLFMVNNPDGVGGGNLYSLRPYKMQGYYQFKNEYMRVDIHPNRSPQINVEQFAKGIDHFGHSALHQNADCLLAELKIVPRGHLKIRRQDFSQLVVVPQHMVDNFNPAHFLTDGRKTCSIHCPEKKVQTFIIGQRGGEFAFVRIYNKLDEIAENSTFHQLEKLRECGLQDNELVFNVEIEMGGDWLERFGCRDWSVLSQRVQRLVHKHYADSVRMTLNPVVKTANARRAKLAPLWTLLLSDLDSEKISRIKKQPPYGDVLIRAEEYAGVGFQRLFTYWKLSGYSHDRISFEIERFLHRNTDLNKIIPKMERLRKAEPGAVAYAKSLSSLLALGDLKCLSAREGVATAPTLLNELPFDGDEKGK